MLKVAATITLVAGTAAIAPEPTERVQFNKPPYEDMVACVNSVRLRRRARPARRAGLECAKSHTNGVGNCTAPANRIMAQGA